MFQLFKAPRFRSSQIYYYEYSSLSKLPKLSIQSNTIALKYRYYGDGNNDLRIYYEFNGVGHLCISHDYITHCNNKKRSHNSQIGDIDIKDISHIETTQIVKPHNMPKTKSEPKPRP